MPENSFFGNTNSRADLDRFKYMSNKQLEFSIKPYRLEDSNTVNQLCKESIEALCVRNYNSQQVKALASLYHREFDEG